MTWRRGCLFGVIGLLAACLIICGVGYFVYLPRARDSIARDVKEGVGTAIAQYIATPAVGPGTYTITANSLSSQLTDQAKDFGVDKVTVEIHQTGLKLGLHLSNSDLNYTGQPAAENGQFVVHNVKADNGGASFLLPADKLAGAISDGVNGVLNAQGLALTGLHLGEGAMTLTTTPAK